MPDGLFRILRVPLMIYAGTGLVLSFTAHFLSFAGVRLGGAPLFFGLHAAIFPLWFALFMGTAPVARKEFWNLIFSGCPPWMRTMTRGFTYYAYVNFAIFLLVVLGGGAGLKKGDPMPAEGPPPVVWRGVSGHWMVFYSVALAALTSAYQTDLSRLDRRCPNGHSTAFGDLFCRTCGARLIGAGRPLIWRNGQRQ